MKVPLSDMSNSILSEDSKAGRQLQLDVRACNILCLKSITLLSLNFPHGQNRGHLRSLFFLQLEDPREEMFPNGGHLAGTKFELSNRTKSLRTL